MITKFFTASIEGIESQLITVEIDISLGLIQWHMVGLPDLAIKESKERIISAIRNSGIKFPDRKITINLSPADLKKKGSMFDFAIIIGLLDAAGIISVPYTIREHSIFIGEISLDGTITDAKGALVIAADLKKMNKKYLFVPQCRKDEVSLIEDIIIFAPKNIAECIFWFQSDAIDNYQYKKNNHCYHSTPHQETLSTTSLDDVYGNHTAKRALQIAIAGRHNILFIGSPGSGKTFLAEQMRYIMPKLSCHQQIEVTKIYAATNNTVQTTLISDRPFIAPHHSISNAGLIGGGSSPKPGAISLAHHGILFLDELLEYKKSSLEALRQPLESKYITITRAQGEYTFPANFLLVAATNPCPCGYYGDKRKTCQCSSKQVAQYMSKLSGPLLDRIDLHIGVYGNDVLFHSNTEHHFSHKIIIDGIHAAEINQEQRYKNTEQKNGNLSSSETKAIAISDEGKAILEKLYQSMKLSMRSYFKIIKVARTIADIENSINIEKKHIIEASTYRIVDLITT